MRKKHRKMLEAVGSEFNKVYKHIQGIHKEIRDTQGDIPATVGLEKLGDDYWHFIVKSKEGEQECSVKGGLSMILHMGVCFRRIYDWDEKKEEKKEEEKKDD